VNFDFQTLAPMGSKYTIKRIPKIKAVFYLVRRQKGSFFFTSEQTIGKIIVPLQCLANQCECAGTFELIDDKSVAVGGSLTVSIRIRNSITGDKSIVLDQKVLNIGEWQRSNPINHSSASTLQTTATAHPDPAVNTPISTITAPDSAATAQTPVVATSGPPMSTDNRPSIGSRIPEDERKDPLSADLYISYDAMVDEIARLNDNLASGEANDQVMCKLRVKVMEMRSSQLVEKYQNGDIENDVYISVLKDRIEKDKILAAYLHASGRKHDSYVVFRRMNVMVKEVKSVEV